MVEFFIATAQALSLAALLYGMYFVLLRAPHLARTPAESAPVRTDDARGNAEPAERERG